jgi:hypothetical protein
MNRLRRCGARRAASWLVAIVGVIGLVAIATATLRAIGVQKELDRRISAFQGELAMWEYFTKRSQELATKQGLLRAKLGEQATTAPDHELEPCLAAAAVIPPAPSGLEWNPIGVRRAIRERRAWCTSAQEVIASAGDCARNGALEQAVESIDRELAQLATPGE